VLWLKVMKSRRVQGGLFKEFCKYTSLSIWHSWSLSNLCYINCTAEDTTLQTAYCLLLKRLHLTFTAWRESITLATTIWWEGIDRAENMSVYHCLIFFPLVAFVISFIKSLKIKSVYSTIQRVCYKKITLIFSYAQNTTDVFSLMNL